MDQAKHGREMRVSGSRITFCARFSESLSLSFEEENLRHFSLSIATFRVSILDDFMLQHVSLSFCVDARGEREKREKEHMKGTD